MLGGAAFLPLQALAILSGETAVAGALERLRRDGDHRLVARRLARAQDPALVRPGRASRAASRCSRSASSRERADWALADESVFASSLGFMIWVVVTATYLLRR